MIKRIISSGLAVLLLVAAGCGGGGAGTGNAPPTIDLATDYNRQAQQLILEIVHSSNADVNVSFVTPDWVSLIINSTRELTDGRLLMDLNITFDAADLNSADIRIIATDDAGTRATREIEIARPVYFTGHEVSVEADAVFATVSVDAPPVNYVTVTAYPPPGFIAVPADELTLRSGGDFTFRLEYPPMAILAGEAGTGAIHFRAVDDIGHEVFDLVEFSYDHPPLTVPDGALAAVPLRSIVSAGEPLPVAVVAGAFPAGAPFHGLSGAGVTFNGDVGFVWPSFSCGTPGGGYLDPDGIWAVVQPSALSAGTEMVPNPHRIQIGDGQYRLDFSITPDGGTETTGGGVLFVFEAAFAAPGEVQLGFQEFEYIKRTYYRSADGTQHHWNDAGNNYPGVPHAVTVVE